MTKLKKPKKRTFQCGPYTWTEEWIPRKDKRLPDESDGVTHTRESKIFYAEDLLESPVDALMVVLHERIHAAWISYGLPTDMDIEMIERITEAISRGILQSCDGRLKLTNL